MIALLVAVLSIPTGPSTRVEGVIEFDRLTMRRAAEIEGESRTFKISLSSAEWEIQGCKWFECWKESPRVLRTVLFQPGAEVDENADGLLVSGQLRIFKQDGYVELRIVEAVMIGKSR